MKQFIADMKSSIVVGVLGAMLMGAADAQPAAPGRFVDISGRRVHVVEDAGAGPVVVLEAGGGGFSSFWLSVQPKISELGIRVISYDRAGLGWSDPSPAPYRIEDRADDLNALLNALNIDEPIILVGHSYGGWVAQSFAARHPSRIAGIVLADPNSAYFFQQYPGKVARIEADGADRSMSGFKRLRLKLQKHWLSKHLGGPKDAFEPILTDSHQNALGRALGSFGTTVETLANVTLPNVPTIMISRGRAQRGFPWGDEAAETAWRTGHEILISTQSCGEHWIAERSAHAIVIDQPEIIVEAIARVRDIIGMHDDCYTGSDVTHR